MDKVILRVIINRTAEYLGVHFEQKPVLTKIINKSRLATWSQTHRSWLLPLSRDSYNWLKKAFGGVAEIDDQELRIYLRNKRLGITAAVVEDVSPVVDTTKQVPVKENRNNETGLDRRRGIDRVNWHVLTDMEERLKLKAYGQSTIKTYLNEMTPLLRLLKGKSLDEMTEDEVRRYLVYCYEKLKLSENTLHSRINALKFYFEKVLQRERFFWEIPRPKRHLQLPKLLNEDELARLFNSLSNKKHKAMLFTAYSAGLRVSEIVNLKLEDIDSTRMQIFVSKAKGKKDRYVNLSPVLLDILRDYVTTYSPRPLKYLFESEQTRTAYPTRTVQQIFWNARVKAGISKKVGIHSLRHSFATHLLDKGTDIKYIKDLLGHFNIKTTERYLHVSKKQLVNIISPFDDLFRSREIKW